VDIRAKLPAEAGTWPALWTLGANINETGNYHGSVYGSVGWPACGEIDIMEQNGWDKNNLIGHLHWGDTQTGAYQNQGGTRTITNASTDFNLYSLIWTQDEIQILFNGAVFFRTPNTARMPYDNLHYLLLNIAMGGNLGGDIPAGFTQAVMEVDYVRIYQ
jgi:beta-glucanase (GH16 family)